MFSLFLLDPSKTPLNFSPPSKTVPVPVLTLSKPFVISVATQTQTHLTDDVQLIIDFLELSVPDMLSLAKGIETECTVREKQVNYNK